MADRLSSWHSLVFAQKYVGEGVVLSLTKRRRQFNVSLFLMRKEMRHNEQAHTANLGGESGVETNVQDGGGGHLKLRTNG